MPAKADGSWRSLRRQPRARGLLLPQPAAHEDLREREAHAEPALERAHRRDRCGWDVQEALHGRRTLGATADGRRVRRPLPKGRARPAHGQAKAPPHRASVHRHGRHPRRSRLADARRPPPARGRRHERARGPRRRRPLRLGRHRARDLRQARRPRRPLGPRRAGDRRPRAVARALPRGRRWAAARRRPARPSAPPAAGAAASRPTGRSSSAPGAPPRAGRASCATRSSPAPPSTAPTARTAPPPSRWSGRARRGCSTMPGSSPTCLWAVCARAGSPAARRWCCARPPIASCSLLDADHAVDAWQELFDVGPRPRPVDGRRGGARAPRGRAGAYLLIPDGFAAEGREHGGRRRLTAGLRAPMSTSRGRSPSSAA